MTDKTLEQVALEAYEKAQFKPGVNEWEAVAQAVLDHAEPPVYVIPEGTDVPVRQTRGIIVDTEAQQLRQQLEALVGTWRSGMRNDPWQEGRRSCAFELARVLKGGE